MGNGWVGRWRLREDARGADALYVLGDLFEAWVGDDDPSEAGAAVADGVRALVDAGVPVYFMRGNRDFLLGRDYAARAGMTLPFAYTHALPDSRHATCASNAMRPYVSDRGSYLLFAV